LTKYITPMARNHLPISSAPEHSKLIGAAILCCSRRLGKKLEYSYGIPFPPL
jgi:hypothetical protein